MVNWKPLTYTTSMAGAGMSRFELPAPPLTQTGPVKVWSQPVVIPTYQPFAADPNPMFLERRVYQGSSGRVYPLPFTDRIDNQPRDRQWRALHLENEYLRVMVLPEIGGRIHIGLDKTNGYDFFYRQNVIKPALVGLAGPWISGGVEFNWPQHHRPATFLPVDWYIEESADGSRTIWCSDHDPMSRMKGMHGVCLRPGLARIELRVRLYNRTPFVQTFLWWANVATRVHDRYQSFFPPDVHFVADHAKRAMSTFPLCRGSYYGIDYALRACHGVPADEMPRKFIPTDDCAPNDLSWYANIPVPTSYMAVRSEHDFFGGYDHATDAGLVHIANHHISPGKKQWTWGNHEFGYSWDRHLTDDDGPYIELMAGVYTDNQPDFSFLAPGETKTFTQFWYPIQNIGPVHEANAEAALSFKLDNKAARLGLSTTRSRQGLCVRLLRSGETIAEWVRDVAPGRPFLAESSVPEKAAPDEFSVQVLTSDGRPLIQYAFARAEARVAPEPATEPRLPVEIPTSDELYVTGVHLNQYRHATRHAEPYWHEAIRRDPGDARANNALGAWHLKRGEFSLAEQCLHTAIERLTKRNPNPYDGEPYYNLGLTLRYLGRRDEAYGAFYKATWNYAWRSASYFALAEIDASRGAYEGALEHVARCLRTNSDYSNARNLAVVVLRKLVRDAEAEQLLLETLALDPLDYWANFLANHTIGNNQARLDVAFDLLQAGVYAEAKQLLESADLSARDGSVPVVLYSLAHVFSQLGDTAQEEATYRRAAAAPPVYCFPSRLEEFIVLEAAVRRNPDDARAHFYLGNWLYDRQRYQDAISHWERAAHLEATNSVVWRNLGIAYFNVAGDVENARFAFENAVHANPQDARVRYERDQLWKRTGIPVQRRLAEVERALELVERRDDLTVELAALYNQTGQSNKAAALLRKRHFQPWEGGEGAVLREYVRAQLFLSREALELGETSRACRLIEAALEPPDNLGETWHLLANRSHVYYWLGVACGAKGDLGSARNWWEKSAASSRDFQEMSVRPYSEMTYYSALALARLDRRRECRLLLRDLLRYARNLRHSEARIDYFATSLPAMLLFEEDLQKRTTVTGLFLEAQAALGLGYQRRGRRLLQQVLHLDPNHSFASDLLSEIHTQAVLIERPAIKA